MSRMDELKETIRILRSENGCPWDRKQTLDSMKKCIVEEAAEVIGGINVYQERSDASVLKEELGDLLLQVVMESEIAEEMKLFTLDDVIETVNKKMIQRHPYVFEQQQDLNQSDALDAWNAAKSKEKQGTEWNDAYTCEAMREAHQLLDRAEMRKHFKKRRAQEWIQKLNLQRHPEGGWFSEVYTAGLHLGSTAENRNLGGSIYFMLEGKDISHFHVIDTDEIWYHHEGCGVRITFIDENGCWSDHLLGAEEGMEPMVIIPRGIIFGAECLNEESYELMSCATFPSFRYEGFRLVSKQELIRRFPDHEETINKLAFTDEEMPAIQQEEKK